MDDPQRKFTLPHLQYLVIHNRGCKTPQSIILCPLWLFPFLTDSSHLSTESRASRACQYYSCPRTKAHVSDFIFITVYPEKLRYLLSIAHPTPRNSGGPDKKKEKVSPVGIAGVAGISHGNAGFYNSPLFVGGGNVTLLPGNLNDSKNNKWLM